MRDSSHQGEHCAVCGKNVADAWFAHLRNGDGWVKLCSPACSIRYTDLLRPGDDWRSQPPDPRDGRCHFFVHGECWA